MSEQEKERVKFLFNELLDESFPFTWDGIINQPELVTKLVDIVSETLTGFK